MDQSHFVTRRVVLRGAAALGAAGLFTRSGLQLAHAQDTTPAMPALSGYPEFTIHLTDKGVELSSSSVPAGLVLLTVKNDSHQPDGAAVIGPGKGQTMADLQAAAAASPTPGGFPPFLYSAAILGGPGETPPGGSSQAVIQIPAGDWGIMTESNLPPAFFTATAGTPTAQSEPVSTLTVTEAEYTFHGLDDITVPAGPQIWKVTNAGAQPHMLVLGQVPASTTLDQLKEVASRPDNATPAPGQLTEADFKPMGGVSLQSTGVSVWPLLDLPAGRYAAVCFVTDPGTTTPHAEEGMIALFDATGGTPATPTS